MNAGTFGGQVSAGCSPALHQTQCWASVAKTLAQLEKLQCYNYLHMTKLYLDNCALNRPFDDQSQERVRLETEAIVLILSRLERREWTWLGSQALEAEIDKAPDAEQQLRLRRVIEFVSLTVEIGEKELERARDLQKLGFAGFDAVHLACAESGRANVFLTTDDRLLKRAKRLAKKLHVKVENPLDWLKEMI